MMPLVLESAARATVMALIAASLLGLARRAGLRIGPYVEKSLWSAVLAASLAMPWLMHVVSVPLIPAPYLIKVVSQGVAGTALQGASHNPHHALGGLCAGLYALIAGAALLRLAASGLHGWRVRGKAQVSKAPWTQGWDVRVSRQLHGPATFGRTILLPAEHVSWTAFKRAAVLAHERAHVRERDAYLLWLAQLHACVFWFNPGSWWLKRRLAWLAELAADDAALQSLGDRPGYAQILLELASQHSLRSTLAMSQRSHVAARIERVLSQTPHPQPRRRLIMLAAVLPAALAVAALQFAPPAAHAQPAAADTAGNPPRVVSWPPNTGAPLPAQVRWGNLADYYPPDAKRKRVEGQVQVLVSLDSQGHAMDAQVQEEAPMGQGFGAAALNLARTMVYSNPSGQPGQFSFRVTFALPPAATASRSSSTGPQ